MLYHKNPNAPCRGPLLIVPRCPAGVPLLVALAGVVQQDVVLERVGDEPPGVGVVTAVLDAVLLLGQLEELLHWDGFTGRYHQQA